MSCRYLVNIYLVNIYSVYHQFLLLRGAACHISLRQPVHCITAQRRGSGWGYLPSFAHPTSYSTQTTKFYSRGAGPPKFPALARFDLRHPHRIRGHLHRRNVPIGATRIFQSNYGKCASVAIIPVQWLRGTGRVRTEQWMEPQRMGLGSWRRLGGGLGGSSGGRAPWGAVWTPKAIQPGQ